MDKYLQPLTAPINAILDLPGSKSIANRVLLLASLAKGESIIHNVPDVAEDVLLMLEALTTLGVTITKLPKLDEGRHLNWGSSSYKIVGVNGCFKNKLATIFCGNSGTTIRFLTAALALMAGAEYTLTGIERMYERPIGDLVIALNQLGANIQYINQDRYPPLLISHFKDNFSEVVEINGGASSQYLSGVLMALPLLKRKIKIKVINELISQPYVDITCALLEKFGCNVESQQENNCYILGDGCHLYGIEYTIEPDASSASYFLAMGAINGVVRVNNLSLNSLQGDKNFAQILGLMGAYVNYGTDYIQVKCALQSGLKSINVNLQDMPDVAMTIAVLALFANGTSTISGIGSWKVKETDRLLAMHTELTKLGAKVSITHDSITIHPPHQIMPNIEIDTYNDHRMAMCFSLIAVYGVPVIIKNYHCVGKTFANYFEVFEHIC
ncbi:MAG: 3-phosphoshikimate 1-carboxyvinyltransferase [Burkholderiales bacterium]|nr:3-phosphoshikimate 1-carboxyvinyltransferase [Burkholderiales bacterium]